MIEPNRPYKWLAKYYDQFFTFHLPRFEAAREQVLRDILPHLDSACDLACGTGTTALLLAGRGIKMFGVDLSPVMCRLARQKARRAGLPLRILQADMRDFRLPRAFLQTGFSNLLRNFDFFGSYKKERNAEIQLTRLGHCNAETRVLSAFQCTRPFVFAVWLASGREAQQSNAKRRRGPGIRLSSSGFHILNK